MTGIGCVMAAGQTAGGGSTPLSADVFLNQGPGPYNVSGASGDIFSQGGAGIGSSATGGTPPYTTSLTVQGDASGKISIFDLGGGFTLGYSGFAVSEVEICYIQFKVTDSVGAHVTVRYPVSPSQTIAIKRVS